MDKNIVIWSCGGTGDQLLAFRLSYLLKLLYPKINIVNNCCVRSEIENMLRVLGYEFNVYPENWLDNIKDINSVELEGYEDYVPYLIWPDRLFRGIGSPPLNELGITNFSVKQTRTLLGKWKPENYISLALNSITSGYTYHSISELVNELARTFPNKKIYCPLLCKWNNTNLPDILVKNSYPNIELDINPEFSKVFDILCKSEYTICTDNAILHILDDMGAPYLLLDPQFGRPAFESRWRVSGYHHSIPISSLVEDIVKVAKTQIEIPETQMISTNNIFRRDINWPKELIFK